MSASSKPKVADLHANETERLQALRSYAILDTAAESSFDDITKIASYVCQTPVALISLVSMRALPETRGRDLEVDETGAEVERVLVDA